jgi:hypothetical protein
MDWDREPLSTTSKGAHWLPSLSPKVNPGVANFDNSGVDGRYPCLLVRRTRDLHSAAAAQLTRCLPHSLFDVEVDELEIDLRTGLVMSRETDLFVPGTTPLSATRCYRLWDDRPKAFGYNTSLSWDIYPIGSRNPYTYVDLILCDGRRIHFERISEGTDYYNALFEHRRTATAYLRAIWLDRQLPGSGSGRRNAYVFSGILQREARCGRRADRSHEPQGRAVKVPKGQGTKSRGGINDERAIEI